MVLCVATLWVMARCFCLMMGLWPEPKSDFLSSFPC